MDAKRSNRLAVVIASDTSSVCTDDNEDMVDSGHPQVVLRRKKTNLDVKKTVRDTLVKLTPNSNGESPCFAYLTLKVLLWDITVTLGDTITDFCQGFALLMTPGKRGYGIVTIALNWLPGIPAAIHLLSAYRERIPWHRALIYCFLLIAFYPLVPLVAYANLLWKKPKEPGAISNEFREAEFLASLAHALSGGIESPVQLTFQCWMIVNGVVRIDWQQVRISLLGMFI